jgi:hypothetical protein
MSIHESEACYHYSRYQKEFVADGVMRAPQRRQGKYGEDEISGGIDSWEWSALYVAAARTYNYRKQSVFRRCLAVCIELLAFVRVSMLLRPVCIGEVR